jgi:hypothetical protein
LKKKKKKKKIHKNGMKNKNVQIWDIDTFWFHLMLIHNDVCIFIFFQKKEFPKGIH